MITGALPAEYGLRTAGIVDLTTNTGLLQPGGYVSIYGGSFGTVQPAAEDGGSHDGFSYYLTGDMLRNDLGIESPDRSADPLHDRSTQIHGFGFLEDILDPADRLSFIFGTSDDEFQIPNQRGLQPALGLDANGQTDYPSDTLDESQHELTQYAILSWQHSEDVDSIFGTGLRQELVLPDDSTIPNGDHTPSYQIVNLGVDHTFRMGGTQPLTARLDVINLFDKMYEIRSGTGIGVFAPQWGERRGVFGGLEWEF